MKLETAQRNIKSSGVIDEAFFGISTKDQSHILSILRDKLYSDKVLAVVREYSANALDAHIEAGKPDLPIHVTLPTSLTPHFIVRDYGLGLTEDEVFKLYIQYGASTKRTNNDAIGQLGLGCKAAFAYTDSFTVTSWVSGTRSIYHAYIDETNVGKIVKLSSETSNEESGIEIKIAVKDHDYKTFREKTGHIFKYFDVAPKTNITIPTLERGLSGKFWWIPKDRYYNTSMAIMGNIPYPINWFQIQKKIPSDQRTRLDSREALEYTDTTIQNIADRVTKIGKEIEDTLSTEVKKAKTALEARKVYNKRKEELPWTLAKLMPQQWNNISFKDGVKIDNTEKSSFRYIAEYDEHSNNNHLRWGQNDFLATCAIVINDVKIAWVTRIKQLIQDKGITWAAAYTPTDKSNKQLALAEVTAFLKKYDLEGMDVHYLSTIPYQATAISGRGAGKKKQTTTVFKLISPTGVAGYRDYSYDCHKYWEPVEVDLKNDTGVYIKLYRYRSDGTGHSNRDLRAIEDALNKLKMNPGPIYGIKSAIVEKKKVDTLPNWTLLTDFAQQVPQAYYDRFKSRIDWILGYQELENQLRYDYWLKHKFQDTKFAEHHNKNPLIRLFWNMSLFTEILQNDKGHLYKLRKLENIFGAKANRDIGKPITTAKKLYEKYPLFKHIEINERSVMDLIDYVKLVEDSEKRDAAADETTTIHPNGQHVSRDSRLPDIQYRFKPSELGTS
jgi:hypothetical protein